MLEDSWTEGKQSTLICNGCGQPAQPIERGIAIAIVAEIVKGFADLDPAAAVTTDQSASSLVFTVAERTDRAASIMASIDGQLRSLSVLGAPMDHRGNRSPVIGRGAFEGSASPSLFEAAARLSWTLRTLPDLCWCHPSALDGFGPAEMIWVALHQATHLLDDARRQARRAGRPTESHSAQSTAPQTS